jgi:hypothetical protein
MGKPRELFETELAEIREELLRLGVRPSESLQQSSATQKELLEDWQQAGCHWLDRMQLEMALWGELGFKLATTRSALEAFDAYSKCAAQQMKMTAEDAQRLVKDFQYMTQKVTQSLRGWAEGNELHCGEDTNRLPEHFGTEFSHRTTLPSHTAPSRPSRHRHIPRENTALA